MKNKLYPFDEDFLIKNNFTRLERIDFCLYDNFFLYRWLQNGFYFMLKLPNKIKRFFQRRIRGWDDSETWNLDISFFKWLAPRLKRFSELTNGWPESEKYPDFKSWKLELETRVKQCYEILNVDEFEFTNHSYLTANTKHFIDNNKITDDFIINRLAKTDCILDFLKWYSDTLLNLWW